MRLIHEGGRIDAHMSRENSAFMYKHHSYISSTVLSLTEHLFRKNNAEAGN